VHSQPLKAFLYKAAQEMLFNVVKHADVKEAQLRLRRRRGYIYLTVADKGRGFVGQTPDKTGFGLLSIRERVNLLGGRVRVRSAQGKGCIFVLAVPDAETPKTEDGRQKAEDRRQETAPSSVLASRSSGLRVLLVDDHRIVRQGIEAILAEAPDIEVVGQADNGREAVDLAHRLRPEVIVMDVAMPVMAGDEATRQIKQRLPHIRVIALSMFDDARVADRMRRAGAAAYLLKTAPAEELLAAIRGRETIVQES
jgi:CheY-like chemotaxis protein